MLCDGAEGWDLKETYYRRKEEAALEDLLHDEPLGHSGPWDTGVPERTEVSGFSVRFHGRMKD